MVVKTCRLCQPSSNCKFIAEASGLETRELYEALNMGIGMIVVASPDRVDEVEASAAAAGLESYDCGVVRPGHGGVRLEGD